MKKIQAFSSILLAGGYRGAWARTCGKNRQLVHNSCVLQASIGQLQEAHTLFGDYIAAFSHFGWIPEQVSVLLNQVPTSSAVLPK